MKIIRVTYLLLSLLLMITNIGCLLIPESAHGSVLYKNYLVRQHRGREILCEPYIVNKDDWVYKLFREKGEISQRDFPEFLRIFKKINPHINNLDIIRPGEHILIPLKKIKKESLPGQTSGVVSIPFLNIANVSEVLKSNSAEYKVQKGDYVSRIVEREYGGHGSQTYKEGLKLFVYLNPEVSNLNVIYPGQRLYIPSISLRKQHWYRFLFAGSGNLVSTQNLKISDPPQQIFSDPFHLKEKKDRLKDPYEKAAQILEGKLLNQGTYYFPRRGEKDAELDLSQFPLIELQDGARILFSKNNQAVPQLDMAALQSFWKELSIASIPPDADMEQVLDAIIESNKNLTEMERLSFSDHGVGINIRARWILDRASADENRHHYLCITFVDNKNECISEHILSYLEQRNIIIWDIQKTTENKFDIEKSEPKPAPPPTLTNKVHSLSASDRRAFLKEFLSMMGYHYKQDVHITVTHSDTRQTIVSNRVSKNDSKEIIVDFGELKNDIIMAVKKSGRSVIQIREKNKIFHVIEDILRIMGEKYTVNPEFYAAQRAAYHNTRITISGFQIAKEGHAGILIAKAPIHDDIIKFLDQKGFNIILIK